VWNEDQFGEKERQNIAGGVENKTSGPEKKNRDLICQGVWRQTSTKQNDGVYLERGGKVSGSGRPQRGRILGEMAERL